MRLSKKIIALMAVCTLGLAGSHLLHSETVGQKEAKSMAQKFFNESKGYVTPPVEYVYNGKDLTTQRLFTPFYVFNSPTGGFVIVAADNKAFPILGYSFQRKFNHASMTPMVKSVLTDFARDVEMIRYDSRIPSDAIEQWSAYPAVVYDMLRNPDNHDYYAASLDDAEVFWMVRRHAVEFDFETAEPEEYGVPDETAALNVERPEAPVVIPGGAGHFALTMPVEIKRMLVYDVAGNLVEHKTFANATTAHADLAALPNGFYIALLIDSDGICHVTKLYR